MTRISENLDTFIDNSGVVEPHNAQCEEVILGSILKNNILLSDVAPILEADDFYVRRNNIVYTAMLGVAATNRILTPVILAEEIKNMGFDGSLDYLQQIKETATTESLENYTQIVLEKSRQRKISGVLAAGLKTASKGMVKSDDIFEKVSSELFDLFSSKANSEFARVAPVGEKVLERSQQMAELGTGLSGLTTGYIELNKTTSGLHDGNLIIIAARPSVGKSSLAMGIGRNASIHGGAAVAVFSLEMSKEELVLRMLSSEARVDSQKIQNGQMTLNEWKRVQRALITLSNTDIYLDESPSLTPMHLRAKVRRLAFKLNLEGKKLGLIIVDYLQLMTLVKGKENRQQEVSTISRELKAIAKEMNCPLIALSQLSRAPTKRENPRPKLDDLRDSGAIEQDADVVIFIFREEQIQAMPTNVAQAELIIAKQRMGPMGVTVYMGFQEKFARFENAFPEASGGEFALAA